MIESMFSSLIWVASPARYGEILCKLLSLFCLFIITITTWHIQYWLREYKFTWKNNKQLSHNHRLHWFHHHPPISQSRMKNKVYGTTSKNDLVFSTATWWIIDGWVRDCPYVVLRKNVNDKFVRYAMGYAVLNRIISPRDLRKVLSTGNSTCAIN